MDRAKYIALAALVIGFITRLLKSDTKIPLDVPERLRVYLPFLLGLAGAVADKLALGSSWYDALVGGLTAASAAVVGHNVLVGSIRDGQDIPVPGLMKKPDAPSPADARKAETVPAPAETKKSLDSTPDSQAETKS